MADERTPSALGIAFEGQEICSVRLSAMASPRARSSATESKPRSTRVWTISSTPFGSTTLTFPAMSRAVSAGVR